jgi:hypothetical protein
MRQTEELWVDKYKPQSLAELAVHKKKVNYFFFVVLHIVCIVGFYSICERLVLSKFKGTSLLDFFPILIPSWNYAKLPGLQTFPLYQGVDVCFELLKLFTVKFFLDNRHFCPTLNQ